MFRIQSPLSLTLALSLLASACSQALPPPELIEARKAYEHASKTMAAQLAPAQLDTAKQALDKAEKSFEDDGPEGATPDLAYVAGRKAEIAEATAVKVAADRDSALADKQFKEAQLDGLDKTKSELKNEKKARAEAEKKAAAAMASLAEIGKVNEEARGMVITLSGSVLFATGKYELLPIAQEKLGDVVKALNDQGFKSILVEGHTDSKGNADSNETLSLRRAESVRTFMVGRGIPSDKIRAQGLGSSRPIADNGTADGRANNRRVELVVEPEKK